MVFASFGTKSLRHSTRRLPYARSRRLATQSFRAAGSRPLSRTGSHANPIFRRGPAAVGADDLADHETGIVRGKIESGGGDIARLAHPANRSIAQNPFAGVGRH